MQDRALLADGTPATGEAGFHKTYKREVSFAIMAVEILLILWSAITESAHIADLAKFLMPFASALLVSAFGADWWAKQMKGAPERIPP